VGDRIQHHDIDHALYGGGDRYFIRMFFDRSGLSMHASPDDKAFDEEEKTVHASRAIKRAWGSDFEISYP
jgi:hypothetical protein